MIKRFKETIHIKLDPEEIKKVNDLAKHNRTDTFSALLDYFANYSDYDIVLNGDLVSFGNDCMAATCLVNGGEFEFLINSHQANRCMHGATILLPKISV